MSPESQPGAPSHAEILAAAARLTRHHHSFTYLLGLFLIPPAVRPFFYAWYAYFRSLDDWADAAPLATSDKLRFLDQQRQLVIAYYQHQSEPLSLRLGPEAYAAVLIAFDRRRGGPLRKPILDLMACIQYDVSRLGALPEKQELERHIELEVTSYLKTFLSFCDPAADLANFPRPHEGIAGKWAHILRDLIPDLLNGVINVSREDCARFQMALPNNRLDPQDPGVRAWIAAKVEDCEAFFALGRRQLCHHRSRRYKIAVALLCAKYEYYVTLLKKNQYRPQENPPFRLGPAAVSLARLLRCLASL